MARSVTYSCDGCSAVKGKTNHWFSVYEYFIRDGYGGIAVVPFDETKDKHYCGEQCALKAAAAALPQLHNQK